MIKVMPMVILDNDSEEFYGDETGTPDFYKVWTTLHKYLGENIWVSWNYDDFTFEITDDDEGCDSVYDYIKLLQKICEPFEEDSYDYAEKNYRWLRFDIIQAI